MNPISKILIFSLFLILAIGLNDLLVYTSPGLDNSWVQALLMAIQKNEIFGEQFIFNYGPLGYLNVKTIGPHTSKLFILFLTIFSSYNFYQIWFTLSEKFSQYKLFFLLAIVFLLVPFGSISDFSFSYLYFLVFWIYRAFESRKSNYFLLAGIIVLLIFYVKLNLSIVSVVIFLSALLIAFLKNYISIIQLFLHSLFLIFSIWVLSFYLHVDLYGYVKTSFLIIDSYPDGMSALIVNKYEILFFICIEFIALFIIGNYLYKNFSWSFDVVYFIVILLGVLFLMYKQAHTSWSPINEYGFLNFLPWFFLLLLIILPVGQLNSKVTNYFLIITCVSTLGQQYFWYLHVNKNVSNYFSLPKNVNIKPFDHLNGLRLYDFSKHFEVNPKKLPDEILKKIGKSTVDIFQTEIDYIFFNQLNYEHRPIIQSYQACSPELMALNAIKFRSKSAPEFVIYKAESFRDQNPMWVETPSTIELLKRYEFDGQYMVNSDSLVLLKKKIQPSEIRVQELVVDKPALNKEITIPQSEGLIIAKFNFEYSFLGKVSKLLFQPPYLYCKLTYSDGSFGHFRVIPTILKSGVIVNKKITTNNELKTFFENGGKNNLTVHSVYFFSPFSRGFLKN